LISLAQKYMHTTVEMCHKDDIQSCIDLYYEILLKLEDGQDFRYIK
jgi:putative aminopeptidase FrvX